jgi:hypothetical protein
MKKLTICNGCIKFTSSSKDSTKNERTAKAKKQEIIKCEKKIN